LEEEELWHSTVYRPPEVDDIEYQDWREIATIVIQRDHFRCKECKKKTRILTVHHIIPRAQGGKSVLDNLEALCHKCHDRIELMEDEHAEYVDGIKVYESNDWHSWVYGGGRRPDKY